MTPIPDEIIEQVRDAADIVGLVGEYVELRRTGSDYRGPCPFHGGTHRNFAVIPRKQMFYCFVCHEAGDVFTFYMKKLGLDYPSAVREVASKVGVVIPERSTGGPDPREPLFEAVAVAGEWYATRLRESDGAAAARTYLGQRGLELEALLPLGLGFAPKGDEFLAAMRKLGFQEDVLLEAGLLVRREDGSLRPRFWNRLMFPIHDLRGRVVGFGGRVIGDGEPKYLNSPESAVFHKGRLLYNLHHAKTAIRREEQAVIVEGYFDVLRLVETGVEQVVAPLGTGLTAEQTQLLRRFGEQVVLLYDGDAAGLRATFRAGDELLRAGCHVSVATLPPGKDPDEVARDGGADAVRALLRDAVDVLERKLQLLERKGWLGSLAGRRRALDRLVPTIRAAHDPVTRDLYVGRTAEALGISAQSVAREIGSSDVRRPAAPPRDAETPTAPVRVAPAERDLLRIMVHEPAMRPRILEHLGTVTLSPAARGLADGLAAAGAGELGAAVLDELEGAPRALLTELLAQPTRGLDLDAMAEGALNRLDSRSLQVQFDELERALPFAPEGEKPELVRQLDVLGREISKLNPAHWNVIRKGRSSAR
ncbi:MAG: DNA primase [Gemmatimonadetes bacterium RBG_16_66_8]|nr:MAG: DNA primase [Gemmatimonadetes bacterium RBG_16_66_8]